jgi:cardiolipin synthase
MVTGPAAAMLNEVFIADWCFATRQSPDGLHSEIPVQELKLGRGGAECQVVASGPDVPGDPLYEGMVSMIQEAEHSIWIVTPYFIPDEVLLRSLIVKARAGKQVTLITPRRSDHLITDLARVHYLRELCRAGGQVRFWSPGMLHAKALIIDDRLALLGSANFDFRSLFVNFEIGVVIHTAPEVAKIRQWAEALAGRCHAYKPRQRGRRLPFEGVLEDLSRLLAPLL